jgi:hypothetical protein
MINTFPTPYPDESLYSLLGRYGLRTGSINHKYIMKDLFGYAAKHSVPDLPSGIGILSERLGNSITPTDFILNHTLFPFFSSFIPIERAIKLLQKMIENDGSKIHTQIGINASSIDITRTLKHCRLCMEEDDKQYGESYWHRVHQLPGVYICPKHNVLLIETKKKLYEYGKKLLLVDEDLFTDLPIKNIDGFTLETLSSFSIEAQWILNNSTQMTDFNYYSDKYITILKNLNLASVKGKVDQQRLLERFSQKYNETALFALQSEVNEKPSNWLVQIVQKHRKVFHPIRHILFIMFLCGDLKKFYENEHKYIPFGEGPWPCLNPSHKYGQKVITAVSLSRCSQTRRPVGTFLCDCGFSYSRRGPDLNQDDEYKIGKVVEYGNVWRNELKRLISLKNTLTDIARKLKVDPQTIKRQAVLLNIEFSWKGQQLEDAKKSFKFNDNRKVDITKTIVNEKRCLWNQLVANNLNLGIKGLMELNPSLYFWLYNHDQDWLKENSPSKIDKQIYSGSTNWEQRDKLICLEVRKIIDNWENDQNQPRKITKTTIARRTKKPYLILNYGHKLPETLDLIISNVESVDEYNKRKLRRALQLMILAGETITESSVYKKASVNKTEVSTLIKDFVSNLLCKFD